jgi:hypothetical protein
MKISSKAEFFRLWELGVLGNRNRLWHHPIDAMMWGWEEYLRTGLIRDIAFRELGKAGGGRWQKYRWYEVDIAAEEWEGEGRKFICDDAAPNHLTTLCGEVCRTYRGLEGTLAVHPFCGIRDSMKKGLMIPRQSTVVLALLERFMDPSSRDDLDTLLDIYPDATVEFSCFSVDAGIFPGRNTIFWETRDY